MSEKKEPEVKQDLSSLTPEERAIFERVRKQDDSWQTITEESAVDYSLSEDQFKLPEPALKKEQGKLFAFRWIERKPARVDTVTNLPVPRRWYVCNSVNTPFLKDFIDPVLGCVVRLDQMLVFKPWWMHDKEREMKFDLAERGRSGELKNKDGEVVDEYGSKILAGKEHKIGGKDVVVAKEDTGFDEVNIDGVEDGKDADLG